MIKSRCWWHGVLIKISDSAGFLLFEQVDSRSQWESYALCKKCWISETTRPVNHGTIAFIFENNDEEN